MSTRRAKLVVVFGLQLALLVIVVGLTDAQAGDRLVDSIWSSRPAAVASSSDLVPAVLYVDGAGHVHELALVDGWRDTDLTAAASAPAASSAARGYVRSDERSAVVYNSSGWGSYVHELRLGFVWDGSDWQEQWTWTNLTAATSAPMPDPELAPFGYVRSDGIDTVVYKGKDGHIYELRLEDEWLWADLTFISGATLALSGPVAYVRGDGIPAVVYSGTDGHIHEIRLDGSWKWADLTALASGPLGFRPSAYVRGDGISAVVYVDLSWHIGELRLESGWHATDLTAAASAPTALGDPWAYVRGDGVSAVVYEAGNGRIYELRRSGGWQYAELTAGLNLGTCSTPAGYVRADGLSAVVYGHEDSSGFRIHELRQEGGWQWTDLFAQAGIASMGSAPAPWPYNRSTPPPPSLAITRRAKDQLVPRAAYSGYGDEYLVVWEDQLSATDHDIYARRVGSDGSPLGSEIGIASGTALQQRPDVACHSMADGCLIVWEHESSAGNHDIRAQRMTIDGTLVGSELNIAWSGDDESHPAVAYNAASNEYLIVYGHRTAGDEYPTFSIYGQRVHPDGVLLGGTIVLDSSVWEKMRPAVAWGAGYLVAWEGKDVDREDLDIFGQRLSDGGTLVGGRIGISTLSEAQLRPRVAYSSTDDKFLVVWEDHHVGEATGWDIYGQLVSTDGSLDGSHLVVSGSSDRHRFNPDVAFNPLARSYLVVWEHEYDLWNRDIHGRRVAFDGTRPETEIVVSDGDGHEMQPVVTQGNGSGWTLLVAWEDHRDYATQAVNIYGHIQPLPIPRLSGHVYSGTLGITSDPLAGVSVELYCSQGTGELGERIQVTTTDSAGGYALPVYGACEVYHILELDPPGYFSVDSSSGGGFRVNSNLIYYAHPLQGKVLTGNDFWDYPEGDGDPLPPGNWANFTPPDWVWVNEQTVTCQVQVEDTVSGLNVSSAKYAASVDGGSSWSGWQSAACTGSDGTTDPQTIIAYEVPFGQDSTAADLNRIKFRIADMEQNVGESSAYSPHIDTAPPQNPTSLSCPDHPAQFWSSNNQVTCQWSGASDETSGVAGYTLAWDHVGSTIPDLPKETADTEVTVPLSDSDSWYLHVRAVDEAGNGAQGAVHYGPIRIDTKAPTAWFIAPAPGDQNRSTFEVSWSGSDVSSGIATYDVQKSSDGVVWTDWHMGVSDQSASFFGQRGETYHFRVRAKDYAGNVGDWSSPRQVKIGVTVTVRVEDEDGTPLSGADVYRYGSMEGVTYSAGTRTLYNVLLGDQLSARYLVEQQAAEKSLHTWVYGSNGSWAYRIYLTSIDFDDVGNAKVFKVTDTGATQVLRVRKDNVLVGFYVLVSVEWDASSTFLSELRAGFTAASHYLFDLTDGQMYFEVIDIQDDKEAWVDADYRVYADNQITPHARVGGIWEGRDRRVTLGRYWGGGRATAGPWNQLDGFRTLVHEFGHYGLDLYDEYQDANGGAGGRCTTDRLTTPAVEQACFMDYQYTATEICSSLTLHPHSTDTEQHAMRGEPCWETIHDRYSDEQAPARWTVERPQDRGSIMPGPGHSPVADWRKSRVEDKDTGVCPPFEQQALYNDGSMALGFDVWVENGREIYQGQTVTNTTATAGVITILGAHDGDTVRFHKSCGWFCSYSSSMTVNCSSQAAAEAPAPVTVAADPFTLDVRVRPLAGGTSIQILAQASTALTASPAVTVRQDGAAEPIDVALTYDGSQYRGTATLDPALGLRAQVWAQATATSDDTVTTLGSLNLERVSTNEPTWVRSQDGRMELSLKPGALSGEPVVSLMPTDQVPLIQGNRVVVGRAYEVSVSNGDYSLDLPATVNIYFQPGTYTDVDPSTMRIYHWDAQSGQWVDDGGIIDTNHHFVSARVTSLSTFAILAEKTSRVYLPLVIRWE